MTRHESLGRLASFCAFVAVVFGVVGAAFVVHAQPTGVTTRKIGLLAVSPAPPSGVTYPYLAGLRQGLRERGWVEGQNLVIEPRWGADRAQVAIDAARDLVKLSVDVIVTYGNATPHLIRDVVNTTPIVALSCDPLEHFVTSLARPSGNITGTTCQSSELIPKKLDLLLEAVPAVKRLAILYNPADAGPTFGLKLAQEFAARRRITLDAVPVKTPEEFEAALAQVTKLHPDALYVYPDPLTARFARRTIDFVAKERIPTMYGFRQWPEAGGLMSYGSIIQDLGYRGAAHVDKIFRGAKPADLPVEQSTKFELVINVKTAKALGLTIPQSLLLRADQVIE